MYEQPWLDTYDSIGIDYHINMPAENTSLIDIIERSFQRYAKRDAYISMGKTMTFRELDRYSRQIAAYLQSLGLKQGDRVALMAPNILQFPMVAFGVIRAGYTLVNVNPLYTSRELAHQLHDSGAKVLFVLENFAKTYQDMPEKYDVEQVVVMRIGDMLGTIKGLLVNTVIRHVKKMVPSYHLQDSITFKKILTAKTVNDYRRPEVTLDDIACLQYTGGTTGVAKGAMLSHSNLVANLIQCSQFLSTTAFEDETLEQEVVLTALPLYHIFSFMVCGLYSMYDGKANLLITNPRDIPNLVKEVEKYQPAFFPAVNTLFNALAHNEVFQQLDFSRLKIAMGGGMSVLPSVAEKWHEITGRPIIEGYGLSETSPVAAANPVSSAKFSGKIGIPLPDTILTILDEDDKPLPLGERGEIAIKGPQVMMGYWNKPEETNKVMTDDGFFKSGDIGIMDEQGYFKIVDRKKDMILVSGFNVYPNEIEEVLSSHPKIVEVGVIGVPDERSGEVPKAYVVKADASLTEQEVLDYASKKLTGYKKPRYVSFIDELPKSNVGKILRKDLRHLVKADEQNTASVDTDDNIA